MELFTSEAPFTLEQGGILPGITIAYHTFGELNHYKNNVVWICHALTANSNPMEWWPSLLLEQNTISKEKDFIICANILGSCYGTTGPLSLNPITGQPYYGTFPLITIRDMVKAHQLLAEHLGIHKIKLLVGGSMGGYQALEWCVFAPSVIEKVFLITTSARESAWGIAIHTAQRLAIETDPTFGEHSAVAGKKGLITARAIGMLTYRSYPTYVKMQTDADSSKLDGFKASSYIEYQGNKLAMRFNAYSYWILTKAMDSHNLSRGRNEELPGMLNTIKQPVLIMGIRSDLLCPLAEQQFLAQHINGATFVEINSDYGHDGFLVEGKLISNALAEWMDSLTP